MPSQFDPLDGMWRTRLRPRPPAPPVRAAVKVRPVHVLVVALVLAVAGLGAHDYYARHHFPPGPSPTPHPPKPVGALRVILVSDSGQNMSQGQLDALNSTAVREWLNTHCGKDADGRPAWRSWDKDVDPSNEPDVWQKAWAASKPELDKLPAVVVIHGQKGEAFPLPDTEQGLLDLLNKQGGK